MNVEAILSRYALDGKSLSLERYGDGHINDTYRINCLDKTYLLQRLSPVAFKHPEQVMCNIAKVTAFLRDKIIRRGGDADRETLTLIPTAEGQHCVIDNDGCWRMFRFIADTQTFQLPENERIFFESGRAFGRFMRDLADFPAGDLHETIPHFHDTPRRIDQLREAAKKDAAGRAEQAKAEIQFVLERSWRADRLVSSALPLRVTHNDTKLNNVLMNAADSTGLCVIDLDTVMPGLCAYDFGDAIRFGANTAVEDEPDLSKVHFNPEMFRAYAQGYLGEAGSMLSLSEIESLPLGAWMMTYECAARFLADYLNGDVYFHIAYPEHNLVRARNQLTLLADMERHEKDLMTIVSQCVK